MNGALAPNRNDVCSALMAPTPWPVVAGRLAEAGRRLHLSALHGFKHFVTERRGRIRDPDTGGAHGLDLELGGVVATRDHRTGMAHAPARRRGAAGNEADDRFPDLGRLDVL